jgi:hypothetical protein
VIEGARHRAGDIEGQFKRVLLALLIEIENTLDVISTMADYPGRF